MNTDLLSLFFDQFADAGDAKSFDLFLRSFGTAGQDDCF
jgi:hypothetical protein